MEVEERMFVLSGIDNKKMKEIWNMHRLGITGMNIYFQNIRALKTKKHKYITEADFEEHFRIMVSDIDLESDPVETIIPNDKDESEEAGSMFSVNTEIPEYKRIAKRFPLNEIMKVIPIGHDTHKLLLEHPEKLPDVVDELIRCYIINRYMLFIDQGHLEIVSNMAEIMNLIIEKVDRKKFASFCHSTRINFNKYEEKIKSCVFRPEYKRTCNFYSDPHGDIPVIDVERIMGILLTNVDTETDLVISTAIYMTLSYAVADISTEGTNLDEMPHIQYVKNVLAKLFN